MGLPCVKLRYIAYTMLVVSMVYAMAKHIKTTVVSAALKINRLMKVKLLAGLFALFAIPLCLWSQEKTVPIINSALSGKVVDAVTHQVLADAVVLIKGTTHEVTTNSEGGFSFKTGQKLPYTLSVSFVGYQTLEYVASSNDVVVALQPINNQLNDVVVVGYGTQRKS